MNLDVEFIPEARDELQGAYDWYEEKRQGLGQQFILSVDAAIQRIRRLPQCGHIVHRDLRRVLLDRFPHGLFYLVHDDRLLVVAVFHVRRDPEVVTDRLDGDATDES